MGVLVGSIGHEGSGRQAGPVLPRRNFTLDVPSALVRHTPVATVDSGSFSDTDSRAQPSYGISEAARYLRVPPSTLSAWVRGQDYVTGRGDAKQFKPVIEIPQPREPLLSFVNLVEAHVLNALRRQHRVALPKVRAALEYVRDRLGLEHPLANARFQTDGVDVFVQHFGALISVSERGQVAMSAVISAHLQRVEHDASGLATRLYPFVRSGENRPDDPRIIVIDPWLAFGRPAIAAQGVATDIVAERYRAGERMDSLADDYGCGREEIEEAVRCEFALAA